MDAIAILPDTRFSMIAGSMMPSSVPSGGCGLRSNDSVITCWCIGCVLSYTDILMPMPVAQFAANIVSQTCIFWTGILSDGEIYTAACASTVTPLSVNRGPFVHVTTNFALHQDGTVYRIGDQFQQPVLPFPASGITSFGSYYVAAIRSSDSKVVTAFSPEAGQPSEPYYETNVSVSSPPSSRTVDALHGDDELCSISNSLSCRTLGRALALTVGGPLTVTLMNGTYTACNLVVNTSYTTIQSACPVAVSNDGLASSTDCLVVLDCTRCRYCVTIGSASDHLTLSGIVMRNSTTAAVSYYASLRLVNVTFESHTGSIINKLPFFVQTGDFVPGLLECDGCLFQNNVLGGLAIRHGGDAQITRSVFRDSSFVASAFISFQMAQSAGVDGVFVTSLTDCAMTRIQLLTKTSAPLISFADITAVTLTRTVIQHVVADAMLLLTSTSRCANCLFFDG